MKKLSYLLCALMLFGQPVNAQFNLNDSSSTDSKAVLSLNEGIVQQTSEPKATEETVPSASEDKGIFSFMDFSFLKKDGPKLTAGPNERKDSFVEKIVWKHFHVTTFESLVCNGTETIIYCTACDTETPLILCV